MMLVTGFGPYKEEMNASGAVVSSMKDDLPNELTHLRGEIKFEIISCDDTSRETEHRSLESQLADLLRKHKPELCLFTGQAPSYNKITIEKIAINSFMREVIDPLRPVAYWADMPGIDELPHILEKRDIPAAHSFYAGQHLCNHILFTSRYLAEQNGGSHKSGFVHVPVLPEQVRTKYRQAPHMPLSMSREAMVITINHVFRAGRHNE